MRVIRSGFKIEDGRVRYYKTDEEMPTCKDEICDGCPLTRCIGDIRFKVNKKQPFNKQAVIPFPDISMQTDWRRGDFVILGSSGFWDLMGHTKATIKVLLKHFEKLQAQSHKISNNEERL